jgi:hypothetical protein
MAFSLADLTQAATEADARRRRQGVVVYSPNRRVPDAVRGRAAPPPRARSTAAPVLGGGGPLSITPDSSMGRFLAQKGEREAQKQAQQQAEDDLPLWKKGLGAVVGNPVVKAAVLPLNLLGTGRKAIELGIEEGAKHMTDAQEGWLEALLLRDQNPYGGIFQSVDEDRTAGESNWGKLAPNSDYGFGSIQRDAKVPLHRGSRCRDSSPVSTVAALPVSPSCREFSANIPNSSRSWLPTSCGPDAAASPLPHRNYVKPSASCRRASTCSAHPSPAARW